MFNKKSGQIGETVTWVVATVTIVVILLIAIFVATSFFTKNKKADFLAKQSDILASESFFAYLLTEDDSGQTVYEQIKNLENLNEFNGNFAIEIFDGFYSKDYPKVWLGIIQKVAVAPSIKNEYFGSKPVISADPKYASVESIRKPNKPYVSQNIILTENKSLELVLTN